MLKIFRQKPSIKFLKLLQGIALILMMLVFSKCKTNAVITNVANTHQDLDTLPKELQNSALKKIINRNPTDNWAFYRFNLLNGGDTIMLNNQYKAWMRKFPKVGEIPLNFSYLFEGLGKQDLYLKQAVKINPKLIKGWASLSLNAYFNNDSEAEKYYLKKGVDANPENAEIFYRYVTSFSEQDKDYEQGLLQLIEKFPNSEFAVKTLKILANYSKKSEDKIMYYERIKQIYFPQKFNQATDAMLSYYSFLLEYDVERTLPLLNDLLKLKFRPYDWNLLLDESKKILCAQNYIKQQKGKEALTILNTLHFPYFVNHPRHFLPLFKAQASAATTDDVYDDLIDLYCKNPTVSVYRELLKYSFKQEKDSSDVNEDIYKFLSKNAKQATPFKLYNYQSRDSLVLASMKGSVVLLTYWFPKCSPCRAEFPHFENVLSKYLSSVKYVAINIEPKEADLVLPMMKAEKYSFIPLKEKRFREKGNLDNMGFAPANFLVDKSGKLIFSDFRVDGSNEADLKLMLDILTTISK